MARLNAGDSDDLKIAKLRIDLEKFRSLQAHTTWRYLIVGSFLTGSLGIMAWMMVRLNEKPAWLELALVLITSFSGPLIFWLRVSPQLKKLLADLGPRTGAGEDENGPSPGGHA